MMVWLFEYDGELHLEDATTDEVADCRWMTVSEIRKLAKEKNIRRHFISRTIFLSKVPR